MKTRSEVLASRKKEKEKPAIRSRSEARGEVVTSMERKCREFYPDFKLHRYIVEISGGVGFSARWTRDGKPHDLGIRVPLDKDETEYRDLLLRVCLRDFQKAKESP